MLVPNIKMLIVNYCRDNGYDGLQTPDGGCRCEVAGGIMCCNVPNIECRPWRSPPAPTVAEAEEQVEHAKRELHCAESVLNDCQQELAIARTTLAFARKEEHGQNNT